MRFFNVPEFFKAGAIRQALERAWENRIFQFFNLSRGRLYLPYARGLHHTHVERLNNLKDLIYIFIHQGLIRSGLALKDPEAFEGFPGLLPARIDLVHPRVRATAAVLAGRRRCPDHWNPRRS